MNILQFSQILTRNKYGANSLLLQLMLLLLFVILISTWTDIYEKFLVSRTRDINNNKKECKTY